LENWIEFVEEWNSEEQEGESTEWVTIPEEEINAIFSDNTLFY
jgi:hypothetical protein